MKLYIIYSTFMCLLNTYHGQHIVEHCPLDITSWNKRSIVLDCAKGLEYHCILTYNATLFEVCIERKIYEADRVGCPWIQFHNNEPLFGAKNTKCPDDLKGCPPKVHRGYGSDQLYLYPMCLVPEKNRFIRRGNVTLSYEHVTKTTTRLEHSDSSIVNLSVIVSLALVSIILFILLVRRKRAKKGDPEQDEIALIQQPENYENRSKYNYVWRCGVKFPANEVVTRMIPFKCMDISNLESDIETFKERINTNPAYYNNDNISSLDAIAYNAKHEFRSVRDRFQTTIAVFLNVNKSTADVVKDFTRFLLKRCCVDVCIAYSNDKDVFVNTEEMLYKLEKTSDDFYDEVEYAMVDDVSELTNENPIVHRNTNYITYDAGSVPDEMFLCNSFPSFSLKERSLLGIFMFILPKNAPIGIFQRNIDLDLSPEIVDSFVRKISEVSIGSERCSGGERYLEIREEIPMCLRDEAGLKGQSLILASLLHTFNCLFLKDQTDQSDKKRCSELLEHALEALKYKDMVWEAPSIEKAISLIMVCEGIAHTYANMNDLQNEIKYKREAIDLYNKHILGGKFEQTFYLAANSTLPKRLWYRETAAGIIREIECFMRKELLDSASLFIRKLSIKRCRTSSNTKTICTILEKDYLDREDHLSEEEFGLLSKKGFAVSGNDVGRNFLIELLISLYYGYGCVAFYDLNSSNVQSYIDNIQISYHMSKILGKFLPCHTPLCKILTDVFGRMEILLSTYETYNKGRNLSTKERRKLIKFDRRLSERMNESCKFFEYGVFVYDNNSSSHQDACQRQRSRCQLLLSKDNSSSLPMDTLDSVVDCKRNLHLKSNMITPFNSGRCVI